MKKTLFAILIFCASLSAQTVTGNSLNINGNGNVSGLMSAGTFYSGTLWLGGIRPYFRISNDGFLGTTSFYQNWNAPDGWKLWYSDSGYTMWLDNLYLRGNLYAKEMIIDQLKAINGDMIVSSSGMVDSINFHLPPKPYFTTVDPSGQKVSPFWSGDIIMCQRVNMSGATFDSNGDVDSASAFLIKRLIFKVDSVKALRVYYSTLAGAPKNVAYLQKGDVFVRIGNTSLSSGRTGSIGLYVNQLHSPYLQVVDSVNSWGAFKDQGNIKLQLGKLDSLSTAIGKLSGYGIYSNRFYFIKDSNNYFTYDGSKFNMRISGVNVDSITGNIDSAFTLIAQNDSLISLKASKTTADSLGVRLSSDEGDISVNADAISLEVTRRLADSSSIHSALTINANNISSEVTDRTSADNTLQSQITQNASDITLRVSKTSFTGDTLMSYINLDPSSIKLSASKIQIDGTTTFSSGYDPSTKIPSGGAADDINNNLTTINGGKITTGSITLSQLNFTPVETSDIIASINSSSEGITINGSKITINGSTTFASGYDPSTKTTSSDVTTIIGNTVNTGYVNALNITALGTVTTGKLQSPDWGSGAGMLVDLGAENIWIGGYNNPKFHVISDGTLYATGAHITGDVTANNLVSGISISSPAINGGSIIGSTFTIAPSMNYAGISINNGAISFTNFVSGQSTFLTTYDGSAVSCSGNFTIAGNYYVGSNPLNFSNLAGAITTSQTNLSTTTAPSASGGTPVNNMVGSNTYLLSTPTTWIQIKVGSTTYKVPAY